MAKVVQFTPTPEKFGFKPVRKRKCDQQEQRGQLNLFSGGKQVRLSQLSPFEEALLFDDRGDLAQAKELYLKAIQENDCLPDAYCNLGILESQEKNYPKAIDCFTKCLKEQPRHFEAHYNLANLYAEAGNFPLAKLHYQLSIEIEPDFPNSHFNLALTQAMLREIEEAIITLNRYRQMVDNQERHQADNLIQSLLRARV
ncbi:MAG: tetratricopeptide repeat protein [Cyclobacteriaceae bacterium]|nr:tetratricopeptide repeat protein [Cyclobacteriaceae bacterium]